MSDFVKEVLQKTKPSESSRKIKRCGYFWHGFMADVRMKKGKRFSSPDGSLLHAFSIIHELQQRNIDVYRLGENRDLEYVSQNSRRAFQAFSQEKRWAAYSRLIEPDRLYSREYIDTNWPDVDVVLCEWRMPTRYNQLDTSDPDYEADLELFDQMLIHYNAKKTPVICLDLDYAMTPAHDLLFDFVFEPGFKRGIEHHIDIPFVLDDINQFKLEKPEQQIVYIGNRYDRDNEFDKYFGQPCDTIAFNVFGNWLENGRDSLARWPHIQFHNRIQPQDMHLAYKYALATPLLLKDEYNKHGFMSIRLIESLLFGTIPLLPTNFQSPVQYDMFKIPDQNRMLKLVQTGLFQDIANREIVRRVSINSIRQHDAKHFVNKLLSVL